MIKESIIVKEHVCSICLAVLIFVLLFFVLRGGIIDSNSEAVITRVLENNPAILFDLLSKDSEQVFLIGKQGENIVLERGLIESWNNDAAGDDLSSKILLADNIVRGNKNSKVKIIVYSDFICPYCRDLLPDLAKLVKKYDLGYVHKCLQLENINTKLAARYFLAASKISPEKAWKVYDEYFANPEKIKNEGEVYLKQVITDVGLDLQKTLDEVRSDELTKQVDNEAREAEALGIKYRPCIIIGNIKIPGKIRYAMLCEATEIVLRNTK